MSPSVLFPIAHTFPDGLGQWDFARKLDAGARVTIGSDFYDADPSFWNGPASYVLESVLRSKRVLSAGETDSQRRKLAAKEVLRMLTLVGVGAVGRDRDFGSIEIGKRANFVVLSEHLSTGKTEVWAKAKVRETWFEGQKVYSADEN